MRGIDADLERLQPVAVDVALEGEGVAAGRDEAVDLGEGRRFALAQISPENAALLHDRISPLLDALAELGIRRFSRRLQALARRIEQPAMEGAAQAAMFKPAESEISTAMRAVTLDQAIASLFAAKQHEVFAEQFHRAHRPCAIEFVDE